jgi:hypothetical protein
MLIALFSIVMALFGEREPKVRSLSRIYASTLRSQLLNVKYLMQFGTFRLQKILVRMNLVMLIVVCVLAILSNCCQFD